MLPSEITLHGRYRIIYTVDERPGSTVYRARDDQSGRLVLIASLPCEADQLEDLRLLVQQVAAVQHAIILPVLDHFDESGRYFVVCQDVTGQDLERTLRSRGGPLPEQPTLEQAQRVLDALEHLHSQKPALFLGDPVAADIWLGEDGSWRLLPFSAIRPVNVAPSAYRAPELNAPDAEPTVPSDLYALAALLYQALTGWAPPTAEQRKAGTPLNGPRSLNPNISPLAEQVLLRGLQLRPENRYQTPREMHLSLEMVAMMGGRSLGMGADALPAQPAAPAPPILPQLPPPVQPPQYSQPTGGYPAPQPQPQPYAPQPYPTGIYPAPATGPTTQLPGQPPLYPPGSYPPAAPAKRRGISTGCLVTVAILLTLLAVAICAALAWFVPGSPLPSLLGRRAAPTAESAAATSAPASGAPTSAASGDAGAAATIPSPQPIDLGAGAITLQSAAQITQTREITGSVVGPVAYSPDGKTLAVGIGSSVSMRDASSLEEFDPPRRLEGHVGQVFTLAWSPDSALLASGASNENTIRIWDTRAGKQVRQLDGHTDWIRAVVFSPDGKLLASGSIDTTIKIWDVASGNLVSTLKGHRGFISTLAFTPDGKALASSSSDGRVLMWDAASGAQSSGFSFTAATDQATGAPLWATGLSFTPDGKLLAVGQEDGSILLLDAATGKPTKTLTGHRGIVVSRGLQFAPDGKTLASASFDGTVRLWDVASGSQTNQLDEHNFRVLALSFSPDGQRLASTSDQGGQLLVWDLRQTDMVSRFKVGQGAVTALTFSPDSAVLGSVGANGTARLHQLSSGQSRALFGSTSANKLLAFSSNAQIVSITQEGALAIVDLEGTQGRVLAGLDGRPVNVVTSDDGKLIVAGSSTGAIGRWDSATGTAQPLIHSAGLSSIYALALSGDGKLIAAGGPPNDPKIELWDAASGKLLHTLTGAHAAIANLAFQPRGVLLAVTDVDGALQLWSTQDGTLLRSINATQQQRWFAAMAFSPDGTMIMTGSLSGQITFWNAQTGQAIADLQPFEQGTSIYTAAFSPNGRLLALGLSDQTVRVFEVGKQ
jgi:WD40 repeat protein